MPPEDAALLRRWRGDLLQRFHIQCHEWSHDEPEAFLDAAARSELEWLTSHVAQRLRNLVTERARQGNLPWPNASFVGLLNGLTLAVETVAVYLGQNERPPSGRTAARRGPAGLPGHPP